MVGRESTKNTAKLSKRRKTVGVNSILILSLTISGIIVRLVPTLLTGEPFSTDIWPVINIAEKVAKGTAPPLPQPSHANTAYVWPGLPISMAMYYSLVGQVSDLYASIIFTVILTSALTLSLIVLFKRFGAYGSRYAVAYALFFPSFVLMTSAPLKEFLGAVLAISILHIMTSPQRVRYSLLIMLGIASIFAHPVPLAIVLGSIFLAGILSHLTNNGGARKDMTLFSLGLIAVSVIYNILIFKKISMVFRPLDAVIYALVVASMIVLYLRVRGMPGIYGRVSPFIFIAASVIIIAAAIVRITGSLSMGGMSLVLFLVPALAGLAAVFAVRGDSRLMVAKSMLLVIGANAIYLMLWKVEYLMITHRILNYLFLACAAPVAVLAEEKRKTALLVVTVALVSTSVALLGVVSGGDPMTSYWLYVPSEVNLYTSLDSLLPGGSFLGDERVMYFFLDSEENVSVSVQELFKTLSRGCSNMPDKVIVSWYNENVGFVGIVDVVEADLTEQSRLATYGENAIIETQVCST